MSEFIVPILALVIGAALGFFWGERRARDTNRSEKSEAEAQAKELLDGARDNVNTLEKRAQSRADDLVEKAELAAKRHAEESASRLEREGKKFALREDKVSAREDKLNAREDTLDEREKSLNGRASSHDKREKEQTERDKSLQRRSDKLSAKKSELDTKTESVEQELERIAGLSKDQAKRHIVDKMSAEARVDGARMIKNIEDEAIAEADRRAKKIIGIAIQRYAGEYVTDRVVSVVPLPSDDIKGRIIGREGRNIRALEAATGINIIIDDTPEAVILSGFSPMRREVARRALSKLISDGRIHPGRIEEVVDKTAEELRKETRQSGEHAAFELGLHGIHPEILGLLGTLKYRTSYGQNQWSHSIKVGFLCGMMAAELGLNVKIARRAGLLHDIGKALTHEVEGSHAIIGADYCKKHNEDPIVTNAVAAHHEDVPPKSVYAHLVMAADALSGARPGARREILETYVQRLEDMEAIAMSFSGVDKSYAIQAGREIRVMVEHSKISDEQAQLISRDIARRIEDELVYPGQIRVCVIRETRAVEYAR